MIEVFKILHNIYDKEVTEGILNLLILQPEVTQYAKITARITKK